MKLTIGQEHLAAAVGYAARSLPARPPVPILAGILLDAHAQRCHRLEILANSSATWATEALGNKRCKKAIACWFHRM